MQEKIARLRVKHPTDSLTEIGVKAGYASPTNGAWRALNKESVKARIRELMDSRPKLQLPSLMKKLEDGLDADKKQYFAFNGTVMDERTDPDMPTRAKFLDTALELHGVKEKSDGAVVNNFFTKEAIEAFVDAFKRKPPSTDGNNP